ncbi:MAG: hypothetical protein WC489_05640 [Patescibacteria group bacterium]
MKKGTIWNDAFEQLAELGKSTTKHTIKSVGQTFAPGKLLEHAVGKTESSGANMSTKSEQMTKGKQGSTPLDFEKLQKNYTQQDKIKSDALRNRLFQLVKSGDERVLMEKKQKKEEQEKQAIYEEHERRRQEDEKRRQTQEATVPQGKERTSVLSKKKKKPVQASVVETKPSKGKQ